MNAESQLNRIARLFHDCRLEAVMVGNAAAALHGAPVTTLDIDFMFRKTRVNLRKLKQVADGLGGVILKPYYPLSDLYRVLDEHGLLQLDFMAVLHGVKSYASLRAKAIQIEFNGHSLWIAALEDIIASKRALSRAKDRAVIDILEKTLRETRK